MRVTNLFPTLLLIITCAAQAQDLQLESVHSETEVSRQLLDQLRLEHGRDAFFLLEPLAEFAEQLMLIGEFDEAHTMLDQAAQIARLHEGLYTQSQFPFLLAKVENYANRGDWLHARELMEHLHWLLSRQENAIDENLIGSLLELTDLHLRGVAEDNPLNQNYHFRSALQPNRLAVIAAQQAWGRFDMRIPPILYKLVVQQYLQVQTIDRGGKTASSLRTYSGSGASRSRADSRENSYFIGLRNLHEIRTIYRNQEQPQPVALALSEMYLADWHVLFSEPEAARLGYARSFAGLLQAGIEREKANEFFSHPIMLPATQLLVDWDEITAVGLPLNSGLISFQEWSPSVPFLRTPLENYYDDRENSGSSQGAIFSFNLTGLEKFSRWNQGRFKTAVSAAQNLEILRHTFSPTTDQQALQEQILEIRFRPKLINGVPQTVDATLHYQSASAN